MSSVLIRISRKEDSTDFNISATFPLEELPDSITFGEIRKLIIKKNDGILTDLSSFMSSDVVSRTVSAAVSPFSSTNHPGSSSLLSTTDSCTRTLGRLMGNPFAASRNPSASEASSEATITPENYHAAASLGNQATPTPMKIQATSISIKNHTTPARMENLTRPTLEENQATPTLVENQAPPSFVAHQTLPDTVENDAMVVPTNDVEPDYVTSSSFASSHSEASVIFNNSLFTEAETSFQSTQKTPLRSNMTSANSFDSPMFRTPVKKAKNLCFGGGPCVSHPASCRSTPMTTPHKTASSTSSIMSAKSMSNNKTYPQRRWKY